MLRTRLALLVAAVVVTVLFAGCQRKLEGPAPSVAGVSPAAICTEQLTTTLSISGDGLSPLVTDSLTTAPVLNLPALSLVPEASISGGAPAGDPTALPDDSAAPENSRVRWTSQASMAAELTPELALTPGLYTLHVANRNGKTTDFPSALLAVPPPVLARATPDLICGAEPNQVVLTGDFFIRSATAKPTVSVGGLTVTPSTMTDCRALPGPAGLEACKSLTVTLQGLQNGTHVFTIKNPDTVACVSTTQQVTVTVVARPTLTSVVPDFTCTAQGDSALVATGTGFLSIDQATASLVIGAETMTGTLEGCTDVLGVGLRERVKSCTTLRATLASGRLAPTGAFTAFDATVVNPAPAACATREVVKFTTVPRPTVTAVVPDLVCAADGAVAITLTGTGFITVKADTASPTIFPSVGVGSLSLTPASASGCTDVVGPIETVRSCTTLVLQIPQGATAGLQAVTVANPAPAGCTSTGTVTLVIAPPPVLTSVTPDITSVAEGPVTLTLAGSGFIKLGTTLPGVQLGTVTLSAASATGCTAITGTLTGAESCTGLTVGVPTGTLPGPQLASVLNPAPASCASASQKVYLAPAPTLTQLAPPGLCTIGGGTSLVSANGTGFLRIGGTARPAITVGTVGYVPTVDGTSCTSLAGYSQSLEVCTHLTFTVASSDFSASGDSDTSVRNPAPAAASSTPALKFSVTQPPTLTSATPARICAGGGALTLSGTNFTPGMQVTLGSPSPVQASSVTFNSSTSATARFSGPLEVGGPYDVTVTTAAGTCSATLTTQVTVTNGPVVYFVDPPVVFNGINTQATVYASGFSASGLTVSIRLNGSTTLTPLTSSYNPLKANRILVTLPQGLAPGSYDIVVADAVTAQCPGSLLNAFRVVSQTSLSLTAIDPPFGYIGADTAVTITANPAVGGGLIALPRVYLNPVGGVGVAIPLEAVAVISTSRATASVPANQLAGLYDLIVVNPNGAVGLLTNAFRVLPDPVPFIDTVSPQSLVSMQTAATLTITGGNFRSPTVALRCKDTAGNLLTGVVALTTFTPTGINATANTVPLPNGTVCVLRVTNSDTSYADFSALIITNPAQKPNGFVGGPAMLVARRALVSESGAVTRSARFLYAIGGDDGAVTPAAFDSVEAAPVDIFGVPGQFFAQRYHLTVPRALSTGKRLGRWLYVAGGRNGATVLASVERSYLLDPKDRVDVTDVDFTVTEGAGLSPGVYSYRVAAVMGATDVFNPGGENLPSDPFPIQSPTISNSNVLLTLRWAPITGATKYRVYRTAVNAPAGSELFLAEVTAPATSFLDDGSLTPAGLAPLPLGSTGVWTVVGALPAAREGAGSALVKDSDVTRPGQWYLHVVGGRDGAGAVTATTTKIPLNIAVDASQTVGTIAAGTSLGTARWVLGVDTANATSAPLVGTSQYVYAFGGATAGGSTSAAQAALVGVNGDLGVWVNVQNMTPTRNSFASTILNNFLFGFGGLVNASTTPDNGGVSAQISSAPPALINWQNTTGTLTAKRELPGSTLLGSFFYVLGGRTDLLPATRTTDQIVW